jgi:hypothetical protein
LELEISTNGEVVGGVAWPQIRVNVGKLLWDRGPK